jgi:2-polyprenyl-3-methyl-5-hydroxy-6-metoxy-1,4-benzoquinol methylase
MDQDVPITNPAGSTSLRQRRLEPELMDDPALDPAEHARALNGLRRLNQLGRAAAILWPAIHEELRATPGEPLQILDLATGSGDIPRALARRGGNRLRLTGVDISPGAVSQANLAAPPNVRFLAADLFDPAAAGQIPPADIVICSLFLHHLAEPQILDLLRRMKRLARRRVIVSDLERSPLAWWGVWLAARAVSRSPVVHVDSALSVGAGFRREELADLFARAGLANARVRRVFPFRLNADWTPSS